MPPVCTGGVIQTSAASRRRLHAVAVGIDTIAGRVDPGAILRHAIGRSALIDRGALIDRSALIGGHAADFALAIDAGIHFTIDARVVAHGAGLQAVGRAGIAGIAVQAGFGIVAVDAAHLAGAALARHAAVEFDAAAIEAVVGTGLLGGRVGGRRRVRNHGRPLLIGSLAGCSEQADR